MIKSKDEYDAKTKILKEMEAELESIASEDPRGGEPNIPEE